jgi:hypothetical protein
MFAHTVRRNIFARSGALVALAALLMLTTQAKAAGTELDR